jgi:hypothetical protein
MIAKGEFTADIALVYGWVVGGRKLKLRTHVLTSEKGQFNLNQSISAPRLAIASSPSPINVIGVRAADGFHPLNS